MNRAVVSPVSPPESPIATFQSDTLNNLVKPVPYQPHAEGRVWFNTCSKPAENPAVATYTYVINRGQLALAT